jgi:hypothetical protein
VVAWRRVRRGLRVGSWAADRVRFTGGGDPRLVVVDAEGRRDGMLTDAAVRAAAGA